VGVTSWVCTFIRHGKGRQQIPDRDVSALLEAYNFSFEVLETLLGMSDGIYEAQYAHCSLRVSVKVIEKGPGRKCGGSLTIKFCEGHYQYQASVTFDLRSMCDILII
jgi:hypothetical protein